MRLMLTLIRLMSGSSMKAAAMARNTGSWCGSQLAALVDVADGGQVVVPARGQTAEQFVEALGLRELHPLQAGLELLPDPRELRAAAGEQDGVEAPPSGSPTPPDWDRCRAGPTTEEKAPARWMTTSSTTPTTRKRSWLSSTYRPSAGCPPKYRSRAPVLMTATRFPLRLSSAL